MGSRTGRKENAVTVKEYIDELERQIANNGGEWKVAYEYMLRGAEKVIEIQREEAKRRTAEYRKIHPEQATEWRKRNREAYNAYHREYRKRKKEDLTMKDS